MSLKEIHYETGVDVEGRNGKNCKLFTKQMRFNLEDGFPAVTTKKTFAFKAVKSELLWFIEGSGDDNRLKELNGSEKLSGRANAESDYWKPKAKFPGDLGRVYGVQWRHWQKPDGTEVDQLGDISNAQKI